MKGKSVNQFKIKKKLQVTVSIKIARERQGYTQQQMAEKVGIKQQNISRYEKGKVIPSADRFLELVGA